MISKIYSVRDVVADTFGPVLIARNHEVAKRQYLHAISDAKLSAADYVLYCLGQYNDETGDIEPCKPFEVKVAISAKVTDLTEVK